MLRTPDFGAGGGVVATFDKAAGLGTITGDDGKPYGFHCTAIADGTRDIEVGKQVTFSIVAGHNGKLEATQIN